MKIEKILIERGYWMSKEGLCFAPNGKQVFGSVSSYGYITSAIRINGKCCRFLFHRLMGYIKFGDKIYEKGMQVRHLDGNPLNNSSDNIGIGTQSENRYDMTEEARVRSALNATQKVKR